MYGLFLCKFSLGDNMTTLIIVFLCIALMIFSLFFFPKIKIGKVTLDTYYLITLTGALLLIILGKISGAEMKEIFFCDKGMSPVKIIILFLSMAFLSIFLDKIGFFSYLATKASMKFESNQISLFLALFILISILTVFTSNDIIILTFTPFICYFCKHTKINPMPYLIGEFFAANTLSMTLIIGNPTNIYIASNAGITFFEYFKEMALIGFAAALLLCVLLVIVFKKSLSSPIETIDETAHIESKFLLVTGLVHLLACTVLMAISNYIHIEMYLVSLAFAISLIVITLIYCLIKGEKLTYIKKSIRELPFPFIPFLTSMVVLITCLNGTSFISSFSNLLASTNSPFVYGISSFIFGNLLNNIPMSILYSELFSASLVSSDIIYAVIASSNLCALLTPLGSLAGMMFINLIKQQEISISFGKFMKYGIIGIVLIAFTLTLIVII